jgi:DNA-binding MarR family transcriptional regulator
MTELGQNNPTESSGRRRTPGARVALATPNGHALPTDSLRPIDGIDYDVLLNLAGFWLRRFHITVLKSFEKHLSDLQMRPVEAATLILLQKNNDLTQNALASALGTDQSTMVGISTRLEERGFIARRRQSNDRRYQIINLTPAGRKTTVVIKRRLQAHNKNVLRNLSPEERNAFLGLLTRVVD